jgi:conjugative transfer signal peptidase TraF
MEQLARLQFLWAALCVVGVFILLFQLMGIRVNFTGSMPIGIYQQRHHTNIHRGDIISFCLPKRIALVGKSQGYIGSGPCPGNAMQLLKQVIAVPGDGVALSSNFIRVNGDGYFAPQQAVNHKGRHIFHWVKNGIYHNIKTIWVYGSHDPVQSWDSRYFAGIPMNAIHGVYREL